MDRAGKAYWDALWEGQPLPPPVDPTDLRLSNTVKLRFHELFQREFASLEAGARLLEVGCARSTWLPYFAREHGLAVAGLDYSEEGCDQARAILARAQVEGSVVHGDMFAPPDDLVGAFDVVVSFGLVEHFSDTAGAHAALAKFLKPGGILVTVIPNMGRSFVGSLQKVLDRHVYDVHIPLDRIQLARANLDAGLRLDWCRYFMSCNWNVINISDWRSQTFRLRATQVQSGMSKVVWWSEARGLSLRPNRMTSPYIVAIARTVADVP